MNRYVFKITDFSQTSDSSINWQGCQRLILSWCIKQRNNLRVLPVQSYAFLEVWVLTSCLFCVRKQFCMIKMQKFAWEAVKYPLPTMCQQRFNGNSPVNREVADHLGLLVILESHRFLGDLNIISLTKGRVSRFLGSAKSF